MIWSPVDWSRKAAVSQQCCRASNLLNIYFNNISAPPECDSYPGQQRDDVWRNHCLILHSDRKNSNLCLSWDSKIAISKPLDMMSIDGICLEFQSPALILSHASIHQQSEDKLDCVACFSWPLASLLFVWFPSAIIRVVHCIKKRINKNIVKIHKLITNILHFLLQA